jgi:hypothetical protein
MILCLFSIYISFYFIYTAKQQLELGREASIIFFNAEKSCLHKKKKKKCCTQVGWFDVSMIFLPHEAEAKKKKTDFFFILVKEKEKK